jgi:hypothetical protein
VSEVVLAAPLAFIVGVIVGLVASRRYRLIRLNGWRRNGPADWDEEPRSDDLIDSEVMERLWTAAEQAEFERQRKIDRRAD